MAVAAAAGMDRIGGYLAVPDGDGTAADDAAAAAVVLVVSVQLERLAYRW